MPRARQDDVRNQRTYPVGVMSKKLWSLAWASLLAGVLVAGLLYPVASGIGVVSNRAAAAVENVSSELLNGTLPEVTTMILAMSGGPFRCE